MLIVNNLSKNTLSFFKKLSPNGACQRGLHIEQVVDLEKYPLFEAESEKYRDLVSKHRGELARRGVTTLPGLVTQQALQEAIKEVEEKVESSFTMQTSHNIYLSKEDWASQRDSDHVANRRLDTRVAALSCDQIEENSPLKTLFKSHSFLYFIQKILNVPSLYRNVDPIGAVFVNIYKVFGYGRLVDVRMQDLSI